MNVLIVDDQVNVVNGIISGIKWDEIDVTNTYKAYNAMDARKIIQEESIDIMLCDIEMPGEDGINLFRWIRSQGITLECIFLTAHADFEFAKEAIKLGGFDYILQPARYEEVQNTIVRAQRKIKDKAEMQKYSSYGKVLYQKRDIVLEGIIKKLFMDKSTNMSTIINDLEKFKIYLSQDNKVHCALIHRIHWSKEMVDFDTELLRYTFNNILAELLEEGGGNLLMAALDEEDYALLIYAKNDREINNETIRDILKNFLELCKRLLSCTCACYMGNIITVDEVSGQLTELIELKKDNVALKSDVFSLEKSRSLKFSALKIDSMLHWQQALTGGKADTVRKQANEYLDDTNLDSQSLKWFYSEFMQIISKAIEQIGISNFQLFSANNMFEKSLTAYQSIETMKELVDYVADFFEAETKQEDVNYVEIVVQYIHYNIEKDIRRSDIAKIVNLNEDYLSRIFKKEKNISLKEFIILEKMRVAQNLLKTTNFTIGTIAAKVGFENFSHFSQTYKKTMGIPPAEERI